MIRKINYPKHRKPPKQHNVKAHKRKGQPVRSFSRGKGTTRIIKKRILDRRRQRMKVLAFIWSQRLPPAKAYKAPPGTYGWSKEELYGAGGFSPIYFSELHIKEKDFMKIVRKLITEGILQKRLPPNIKDIVGVDSVRKWVRLSRKGDYEGYRAFAELYT